MKSEIEEAMKEVLGKAKSAEKSEDAMKFAQAALNLAQTAAVMKSADKG